MTLCDKVPATLDRRRQPGDVIRRDRIGHDEIPVPLETRRLGRCELMLKPGLPHASPYHASDVPDLRRGVALSPFASFATQSKCESFISI